MADTVDTQVGLGIRCRDEITGFEGVATIQTEHLNGCLRLLLEPTERNSKGEMIERCSFDIQQLKAVSGSERCKVKIIRPKIPMSAMVRDMVTGISGMVVARSTLLGGSPEIGIQPKGLKENGSPLDALFFAENRVEIIKNTEEQGKPQKRSGGPQSLNSTLPCDRIR